MLAKPEVRATWDLVRGWQIHVPTLISKAQSARVVRWIELQQLDRLKALPPGDKKDECRRTIQDLRDGKVLLVISGPEATVFASSERTRPDRTFHIVGDES